MPQESLGLPNMGEDLLLRCNVRLGEAEHGRTFRVRMYATNPSGIWMGGIAPYWIIGLDRYRV